MLGRNFKNKNLIKLLVGRAEIRFIVDKTLIRAYLQRIKLRGKVEKRINPIQRYLFIENWFILGITTVTRLKFYKKRDENSSSWISTALKVDYSDVRTKKSYRKCILDYMFSRILFPLRFVIEILAVDYGCGKSLATAKRGAFNER